MQTQAIPPLPPWPGEPKPSTSSLVRRSDGFPEEAGIDFQKSVIRLPIFLSDEDRPLDIMVFDAYMRIIRERPFTNSLGYRQLEFSVDIWELTNTFSKGLQAHLVLALSPTPQPKSLCLARQPGADFPAMIAYSAIFDVYLDESVFQPILKPHPAVSHCWQR